MLKNIIFITFILQATIVFAQATKQYDRKAAGNTPKGSIIQGIVIDKQAKSPVMFANVILYKERDSTIIAGTVADENGKFKLDNLEFGSFYLVVDFIGYYKKTIPDLKINTKNKFIDLGVIKLNQSAENIAEVEISGEREFIEYKIDRKVINISKNTHASGGTIIDALENAPSLQVDIDGKISMRGSSNFIVLIDGKPSVLDASDILQQIPASSVENVEIITNPSVKYDPDGTTGIINIIMKKEHRDGVNGMINTSIGSGDKYSANLLLNYRIKKLNYYVGLSYGDRTHSSIERFRNETIVRDTAIVLISDSERKHKRKYYSLKAGFDYFISDNTNFSLSGKYGYFGFTMATNSNNEEFYSYENKKKYSENSGIFEVGGAFYSANLNFTHKFNTTDSKITITTAYTKRFGGLNNLVVEKLINPELNRFTEISKYKTFQNREKQIIRLKLDYSLPINKKIQFDAGFQSRLRKTPGDYIFENYVDSSWVKDETLTNVFYYNRDIYSAYSSLSGELYGLQYMLGIRGEYTNRIIKQITTKHFYPLQIFDFFPSLHLTKELSATQQIQLSYSKRVNRPKHWYMNPFPSYSDSYTQRIGNPNLQPEYIHAYEVSYNKRIKKTFYNIEAFYRKINNKITRVRKLKTDGRVLYTFENLNNEIAFGAELSGNVSIKKWLKVYANVNVYKFNIEIERLGREFNKKSVNYDLKTNTSFIFSKNSRLQISGMYNAPTVSAQGNWSAFYIISAAYKHEFFKRKLSFVIKARDILCSGNYKYIVEEQNFYSQGVKYRESPVLTLSLSYKINNFQKKITSRENIDYGEGGI